MLEILGEKRLLIERKGRGVHVKFIDQLALVFFLF